MHKMNKLTTSTQLTIILLIAIFLSNCATQGPNKSTYEKKTYPKVKTNTNY